MHVMHWHWHPPIWGVIKVPSGPDTPSRFVSVVVMGALAPGAES
jgi:hypothetical protein